MSASPTAYSADTRPIHPESLYPYGAFIRCSGITKTRIHEARLQGVELPTIKVGKRLFVPGRLGIAFIERLAQL